MVVFLVTMATKFFTVFAGQCDDWSIGVGLVVIDWLIDWLRDEEEEEVLPGAVLL